MSPWVRPVWWLSLLLVVMPVVCATPFTQYINLGLGPCRHLSFSSTDFYNYPDDPRTLTLQGSANPMVFYTPGPLSVTVLPANTVIVDPADNMLCGDAVNELHANAASRMPCGHFMGVLTEANTQTVEPGVNCWDLPADNKADWDGTIIWDGKGNPDSYFIMRITGMLEDLRSVRIFHSFINGASRPNIIWFLDGAHVQVFTDLPGSVFMSAPPLATSAILTWESDKPMTGQYIIGSESGLLPGGIYTERNPILQWSGTRYTQPSSSSSTGLTESSSSGVGSSSTTGPSESSSSSSTGSADASLSSSAASVDVSSSSSSSSSTGSMEYSLSSTASVGTSSSTGAVYVQPLTTWNEHVYDQVGLGPCRNISIVAYEITFVSIEYDWVFLTGMNSPIIAVDSFKNRYTSGDISPANTKVLDSAGSANCRTAVTSFLSSVGDLFPCSSSIPLSTSGTTTLKSGVYCVNAAASYTSRLNLILDGQHAEHSMFVFKINAASVTHQLFIENAITLVNGTQASNVLWLWTGGPVFIYQPVFPGSWISATATIGRALGGSLLVGQILLSGPSCRVNPNGGNMTIEWSPAGVTKSSSSSTGLAELSSTGSDETISSSSSTGPIESSTASDGSSSTASDESSSTASFDSSSSSSSTGMEWDDQVSSSSTGTGISGTVDVHESSSTGDDIPSSTGTVDDSSSGGELDHSSSSSSSSSSTGDDQYSSSTGTDEPVDIPSDTTTWVAPVHETNASVPAPSAADPTATVLIEVGQTYEAASLQEFADAAALEIAQILGYDAIGELVITEVSQVGPETTATYMRKLLQVTEEPSVTVVIEAVMSLTSAQIMQQWMDVGGGSTLSPTTFPIFSSTRQLIINLDPVMPVVDQLGEFDMTCNNGTNCRVNDTCTMGLCGCPRDAEGFCPPDYFDGLTDMTCASGSFSLYADACVSTNTTVDHMSYNSNESCEARNPLFYNAFPTRRYCQNIDLSLNVEKTMLIGLMGDPANIKAPLHIFTINSPYTLTELALPPHRDIRTGIVSFRGYVSNLYDGKQPVNNKAWALIEFKQAYTDRTVQLTRLAFLDGIEGSRECYFQDNKWHCMKDGPPGMYADMYRYGLEWMCQTYYVWNERTYTCDQGCTNGLAGTRCDQPLSSVCATQEWNATSMLYISPDCLRLECRWGYTDVFGKCEPDPLAVNWPYVDSVRPESSSFMDDSVGALSMPVFIAVLVGSVGVTILAMVGSKMAYAKWKGRRPNGYAKQSQVADSSPPQSVLVQELSTPSSSHKKKKTSKVELPPLKKPPSRAGGRIRRG